jgi:CRP/FNR family cyclic AMP-dependent transcriptional regulator
LTLSTESTLAKTAAAILRRNYLFRDLPGGSLDRLASLAFLRVFQKGKVIFYQGHPGDALFAVASGRVRISATANDGRVAFLSIMEPGDTFGEIAVMDGLPRTAGATALENCRLLVIRRADFLGLLEKEALLAVHLLKLLCTRLRWTSELVEESAFLTGSARLAKRLLTLAALHGRAADSGDLELRISQSELAHFSGVSRQIVNQNLKEWERRGWVGLGRGLIAVRDQDALLVLVRASSEGTAGESTTRQKK